MNHATSDRWTRLWREQQLVGIALAAYQDLLAAHEESHRHYHNLRHISDCLAEFDSVRDLVENPGAVELAIWFHDVIYNTRAPDNEERSAERARQVILQAQGCAGLAEAVWALILATKMHDPSRHPDAALLVDVDLSILGQPEARFWEYEAQIRREYDWVPEAVFKAKRAEILQRFMGRARIYATDEFVHRYEQQARKNLQESIDRLMGSTAS